MAVPGLSVSITRPEAGATIRAGRKSATICGRPAASPKRTSESAAFPRTMPEESSSIFNSVSWKPVPEVSCPITHASVLRTSSTGCAASRTISGYQRGALASCRPMRSPSCTRACWMCRGCFSSLRYSVICLSESWRPNQVFHQNRNGMSTINQAVIKNSQRFRADMWWEGRADFAVESRARSSGCSSVSEEEDSITPLGPLTLFGGRRGLCGIRLVLSEQPAVAQFPESIQEEDPGEAQHNQALEKAIHRGDGPADDDPGNAREGDEAEQNGNQKHQGTQ